MAIYSSSKRKNDEDSGECCKTTISSEVIYLETYDVVICENQERSPDTVSGLSYLKFLNTILNNDLRVSATSALFI